MEISNKVPPVQSTPNVKKPARMEDKGSADSVGKADRLELSAQARELQNAREAIHKMDDVDHAKVARMKAQIENGTYKVKADKIAQKMLEESL